jgi:hypothetical protein
MFPRAPRDTAGQRGTPRGSAGQRGKPGSRGQGKGRGEVKGGCEGEGNGRGEGIGEGIGEGNDNGKCRVSKSASPSFCTSCPPHLEVSAEPLQCGPHCGQYVVNHEMGPGRQHDSQLRIAQGLPWTTQLPVIFGRWAYPAIHHFRAMGQSDTRGPASCPAHPGYPARQARHPAWHVSTTLPPAVTPARPSTSILRASPLAPVRAKVHTASSRSARQWQCQPSS